MYRSFFFLALIFLGQLCFAADVSQTQGLKDKTLSLDYSDMEIKAVLRDVADRFEINVVIPDNLHGRTSVKMRDVTWKQIFHAMLAPVSYTWVEEGQIVKIIPVKTSGSGTEDEPSRGHSLLDDGPWYLVPAIGASIAILGFCHLALFIGVLRDAHPYRTRFAPKLVWALLVLVGGVVPLLGYWIIHHSRLRRDEPPL